MTTKILCAVDGSSPAGHAAACAADLAKETGASLTFVNVNLLPSDGITREYFWDERHMGAGEVRYDTHLGPAAATAEAHGFTGFDSVIIKGNRVPSALVSYADGKGYDHIVIGTDITNAFERIVMGSIATAVVQKAHCPVTVVH